MALTSGRQIAAARALLGLSCVELAELLGYSVQLVTELEKTKEDGRAELQHVAAFFEDIGVTMPDARHGALAVSVDAMAEMQAQLALELQRHNARRGAASNRRTAVGEGRAAVLRAFDEFRAGRSARAALNEFVQAFNRGEVDVSLPPPCRIERLSRRTLEQWLAVRSKKGWAALQPAHGGGRIAWYNKHSALRAALIEEVTSARVVNTGRIAEVLRERFPSQSTLLHVENVNRAIAALVAGGAISGAHLRPETGPPTN